MNIDTWTGCYPSNWKGVIVPDAYAHPAKFSSKLIARIYKHAFDMGWLHEGDAVADPFGGVGLGAFDALRLGLNWCGCELEPRFVDLGNQNIAQWNRQYAGRFTRWGTAQIFQGDSRNLAQVIGAAQAAISSPPYADGRAHTGGDTPTSAAHIKGGTIHGVGINGVVSSPPYADSVNSAQSGIDWGKANRPDRLTDSPNRHGVQGAGQEMHYGSTPGQLGAMSAGDFRAAISSPPFLQTTGGTNVTAADGPLADPSLIARHAAGNAAAGYGVTPGQLDKMQLGDYMAAISSPPYEGSQGSPSLGSADKPDWGVAGGDIVARRGLSADYGITEGQIGQTSGDTFWTAAREIVEQVYQVLAPGGHAIWVVKGFVKNKAYVDFPGQWRELCEAVGFASVHEHRAMLVRHQGTSLTIDGGEVEHHVSSKSFFRRLAEKNGAPPIDYETVLCMVKP
jgi:hypothetical protein